MMDLCISAFEDLKEKISIQFFLKLISFHLEKMGLFDMLYFTGGDLINSQYLTNYTRYENNV